MWIADKWIDRQLVCSGYDCGRPAKKCYYRRLRCISTACYIGSMVCHIVDERRSNHEGPLTENPHALVDAKRSQYGDSAKNKENCIEEGCYRPAGSEEGITCTGCGNSCFCDNTKTFELANGESNNKRKSRRCETIRNRRQCTCDGEPKGGQLQQVDGAEQPSLGPWGGHQVGGQEHPSSEPSGGQEAGEAGQGSAKPRISFANVKSSLKNTVRGNKPVRAGAVGSVATLETSATSTRDSLKEEVTNIDAAAGDATDDAADNTADDTAVPVAAGLITKDNSQPNDGREGKRAKAGRVLRKYCKDTKDFFMNMWAAIVRANNKPSRTPHGPL